MANPKGQVKKSEKEVEEKVEEIVGEVGEKVEEASVEAEKAGYHSKPLLPVRILALNSLQSHSP